MAAAGALAASSVLTWLATEIVQQRRANKLHKEELVQVLRIHEAESLVRQRYHSVETEADNHQHARETLQARYQHEQDIDNERRVATRENIRDDWQMMSDRAETILVVNTLLLATSFYMIIEGRLPESAFHTMPMTAVSYFCSVSCSICLLVSSVRFAVVLRFRVGCTIVEEMREAIARTTILDDQFRADRAYRRCNVPEMMKVAMTTDISFSRGPGWSAQLSAQPLHTQAGEINQGTPLENRSNQSSDQSTRCSTNDHDKTSASLQSYPRCFEKYEEDLEADYKELVLARLEQNEQDRIQLKDLQILRCKPWDVASHQLLAFGTLLLLVATCLLVFGRIYREDLHIDSAAPRPFATVLAAWSFVTPCIATVLLLAYLEIALHRVRKRRRTVRQVRRYKRSLHREAMRKSSAPTFDGLSQSTSSLWTGAGDFTPKGEPSDRDAPAIARALQFLALVNLPLFAILTWQSKDDFQMEQPSAEARLSLRGLNWQNTEPNLTWSQVSEVTAMTWLPTKKALLLSASDVVSEVYVNHEKLQVRSSGTYQLPKPLVGACATKGMDGTGSSFQFGLSLDGQLQKLELGSPARLLTNGSRLASLFGFGSSFSPRSLACRSSWDSDRHMQTQVWLSAEASQSPDPPGFVDEGLIGTLLAGGQCTADNLESCEGTSIWRLPLKWLLQNQTLATAISRRQGHIDNIKLSVNGLALIGTKILLAMMTSQAIKTNPESHSSRKTSPWQFLAAVNFQGHLQDWWELPAPLQNGTRCNGQGKSNRPACLWSTFAFDEESRRMFLMASIGQIPSLALAELPFAARNL
eukprot:TRINITY_DN23789_c0_g1_i1.p1 TRINITY_DN23789_c0_g1~~TRINITY_DN23789_c0_g1_i1.p1  ORF type:complete len:811 (-),score=113.17 TRINITY_DN23789_c0_g1_i1:75-2507(-)